MPTVLNKMLGVLFSVGSLSFGFCSLIFFALADEEDDWVIMIILGVFCLLLGLLSGWGTFKMFTAPLPGESNEDKLRRILEVARDNGGRITASSAAIDADLGIDESKILLEHLVNKGIAILEVSDEGSIIYIFPDLRSAP